MAEHPNPPQPDEPNPPAPPHPDPPAPTASGRTVDSDRLQAGSRHMVVIRWPLASVTCSTGR